MKRLLSWTRQQLRSPQAFVFLMALAMGGVAAMLSYTAQSQERSSLKSQLIEDQALVEVVVSGRPLAEQALLNEDDLAIRLLPQAWLYEDHVLPEEVEALLGQRLRRAVPAGSPIALADLMAPNRPPASLAPKPGYRLISLAVDEASSVSGLIQPGHWVDLWASAPSVMPTDQPSDIQVVSAAVEHPLMADVLAEAVRVVAVGGVTQALEQPQEALGPARYSSLTIELPAGLVATVLSAQSRGRIVAALRSEVQPTKSTGRPRAGRLTPAKPTPVEVIVHTQGGL